ncbi:Nucleosomal histone H3-Lys79 methylase, partial [Kappamyces sp. JEL0680]
DLYTTVQFIAQECLSTQTAGSLGDTRQGILRSIIKACHRRLPKQLKEAVHEFNQVLARLKDDRGVSSETDDGPVSGAFVDHVLEQAYARCVAPKAHLLREYEGFSNNVYGEIKSIFVREIIRSTNLSGSDVFLDMGSGTGNVVLQVAAECLCESYGIEIMENPASLAKKQRTEFLSRMRYYGKPVGRIYLKQGDFLAEDSIQQVIAKADVIFVNK